MGRAHTLNACWIDPRDGNKVTVGSMLSEGEKPFSRKSGKMQSCFWNWSLERELGLGTAMCLQLGPFNLGYQSRLKAVSISR
jgi:hypothetical protein